MFYDVYVELCKNYGVAPTRAALDMGFTKGSVSYWKRSGGAPSREILLKMCDYFDVSMDFLTEAKNSRNDDKPPTEEEAPNSQDTVVTDEPQQLPDLDLLTETPIETIDDNTVPKMPEPELVQGELPVLQKELALPETTPMSENVAATEVQDELVQGMQVEEEPQTAEYHEEFQIEELRVQDEPAEYIPEYYTAPEGPLTQANAVEQVAAHDEPRRQFDIFNFAEEPEIIEPHEKMRRLRRKKNLTLEDFAELAGIDKQTVRRWESGDLSGLRSYKLSKVARLLDTTPEYILGIEDDKEPAAKQTPDAKAILQTLKTRPECRRLLAAAHESSYEDVELAIGFLQSLRKTPGN